jgi:ribosomal protein L32
MEANVIKCPNCGASSTNHTNCEYCGSLLVRFVDKGIDLSTTSYLTNSKVYAGLIDALKQNLDRQELSESAVETGIFYKSSPTVKLSRKRHGVATVFRSGSTTWSDGDPIKLGDKNRGLVIKFSFDKHAEGNDVSDERIERQHQDFKSLGSFPLFTSHSGIYIRPGSSSRFRSQEYAIDFGQDVEGAARLISEVLSKVYGIPEDAQLVYLGEGEEVPVEKIIEEPIVEEEQDSTEIKEELTEKDYIHYLVLIAAAILFGSIGFLELLDNNYFFGGLLLIANICVLAVGIMLIIKRLRKKYYWPTLICCCILNFFIFYFQIQSENNENNEVEQKLPQQEQAQQEQVKQEQIDQILESAYNSGSNDAWGAAETVQDLIRSGYSKERIRGMQAQQGRLNYKDDYGEPKTSEEKQLMEQYGEKYAEGFMKTMFKD